MTLSGKIFQNKEKRKLSKYYNSYIAYNRYNTYKRKSEDAPYKIRKPIEMEANTNFSLQK